jgi:hypothetical protein
MKDPKDMSFNELVEELGRRSIELRKLMALDERKKFLIQATSFNQKYSAACGVYASFCDGRLENVE